MRAVTRHLLALRVAVGMRLCRRELVQPYVLVALVALKVSIYCSNYELK
jgi:hypothetical protein